MQYHAERIILKEILETEFKTRRLCNNDIYVHDF